MPGHSKATMSKDGNLRYTIMVSHRISKGQIDWIREKTGWGEQRTLNWFREELAKADTSDWYGPVWNPAEHKMEFEHCDSFSRLESEGYEFFEGE